MHSESRKSDSDVKDDAGLSRAATGEQLKCELLSRVLKNGYLDCDGMNINSTCWTICIEGYQKENALTGSYICLENGEWEGEGTTCVRKDCGSLDQVIVSLRWLDTVFHGQYLPSLSINYVAKNKVLEKLPPQLY